MAGRRTSNATSNSPDGQVGLEPRAVVARAGETESRPAAADSSRERRQHARLERLAQADAEGALGLRGLEVSRQLQGPLHRSERVTDRLRYGARKGRGRDAAPLPFEQRLAEQVAQARERVAHGWLRQVEPAAGGGDAAGRMDGVEDHQQVQVDTGDMHGVHEYSSKHCTGKYRR